MFQFIAQVYGFFFYYDYFNFFLSIKMRVFIILPSSVIKFECKYLLLLLLLCTASQTNKQTKRFVKKNSFHGKKKLYSSAPKQHLNCVENRFYTSLHFLFLLFY